jgi:hypothetical protein
VNKEIQSYNKLLSTADRKIVTKLMKIIDENLNFSSSKIWHAHPVWFIDGNPVVGYSKLKGGIRLMFWSGAGFDEPALKPGTRKFRDASTLYKSENEIDEESLKLWLKKSEQIQWDYKNIVKRKGELKRLA